MNQTTIETTTTIQSTPECCFWCGSTDDLTTYDNPTDWDQLRELECPTITLCAVCMPEPDACSTHRAGCPQDAALRAETCN